MSKINKTNNQPFIDERIFSRLGSFKTPAFAACAISTYADYFHAKDTAKRSVALAEGYVKATNKWDTWDNLWALRRAGFSGEEIADNFPTDGIEDATIVELFEFIVHWNDQRDCRRLELQYFLSELPANLHKEVMQTAVRLVSPEFVKS